METKLCPSLQCDLDNKRFELESIQKFSERVPFLAKSIIARRLTGNGINTCIYNGPSSCLVQNFNLQCLIYHLAFFGTTGKRPIGYAFDSKHKERTNLFEIHISKGWFFNKLAVSKFTENEIHSIKTMGLRNGAFHFYEYDLMFYVEEKNLERFLEALKVWHAEATKKRNENSTQLEIEATLKKLKELKAKL